MRIHRLTQRDDEGAVAVLVAILFTVFLILAAFAVDIGAAYAQVRQQSVAADAAALAAAAKVGDAVPTSATSCTDAMLTSINAQSLAQTTADLYNDKNSRPGTSGSEASTTTTVSCADNGKAIEVRVENAHPVPTTLAGVIGISSINSNSYAVARYVHTKTTGGLRPWAVCDTTSQQAIDHPDQTFATGLDVKVGVCTTQANGNWGSVDFDGGNNSAATLADWTANGYPGTVTIPSTLPADPGVSNSSALRAAFTSLVNQVVAFPSVTGYNSGSGSNASFPAVGIITAEVCGVRYQGVNYNTTAAGDASDCWVSPDPKLVTTTTTTNKPTSGTLTGQIAVSGSGSNTKWTLTTATAGTFDNNVTAADVSVTIAKGWKRTVSGTTTYQDLTTTVSAYKNPNPDKVVELTVIAAPSGGWVLNTATPTPPSLNMTVTWSVTTSQLQAGLVPLNNQNQPVDHLQFRWVSYTGSWTGDGGSTCVWTDGTCQGAVGLWQ